MVGFAWQEYLCWSFPTENITLRWHVPTQQWDSLPYATPYAASLRSVGSDPTNSQGSPTFNQVVAVRPNSNWIDAWFADPANDLGEGITTDWLGPWSDAGAPQSKKEYRYISILAPPRPGVEVSVTLYRDFSQTVGSGTENVVEPWTGTIDLGGKMPFILQIPAKFSLGTVAELDVSFTSPVGGPEVTIWKVEMYGAIKRDMAVHV